MGLLDFNLDNIDSPGARMGLGLLAAAGPQAVPMSFGQRLAGAMGQLRAEKAAEEERKARQQAQAMQAQMLQLQLEQAQRQKDFTQRRDNYLGALDPNAGPTIQPTMAGAMAAGLSPQEFAALNPQPKNPADMLGKIDPKDYTPESFGEFMRTGSVASLRAAPKEQAPDEFERALRLAGIDPSSPAGRKLAAERAAKLATHQAPVQVSYGAPMPGRDAQGNDVFFMPPKDPKNAPAILPGITPPKKAQPVEFTKSIAGLNELENGLASYDRTLKENGGVNPVAAGKTRANLQSAYTSLQMGLKNAFELGALAGPDLAILQGMIVDPTSPKALLLGDKGVAAQNEKAREYLRNRRKAVYDAHGEPVPISIGGGAPALNSADPLGLRK